MSTYVDSLVSEQYVAYLSIFVDITVSGSRDVVVNYVFMSQFHMKCIIVLTVFCLSLNIT